MLGVLNIIFAVHSISVETQFTTYEVVIWFSKQVSDFANLRIYIGILSWFTPIWPSKHSMKHFFCMLGFQISLLHVAFHFVVVK